MHFPINFHFGSLEIDSHLVFEVLAYTIGFKYYTYLRKKEVDLINESNRLWIFIGAATGGLIFSRLLGMSENLDLIFKNGISWEMLIGSKTIVGGLIGGLIGVEFTKKLIGVKTSSGDLMTFPLILGIGLGRIGCFLKGLEDGTYGVETTLPWGINFGDGIYRHPTNLYEILFLISLGLIIYTLEKKVLFKNGSKFKIFLSSYLLFRFLVEFIKPFGTYLFLSPIQIACFLTLIYYYKVFISPKSLIEKNDIKVK